MLCLKSRTDPAFVQRFEANLEEMLLDHAHCEKKAASTALQLIFRYPEHTGLVRKMAEIVEEEMEHFRMVLDLLDGRGWTFRRLDPSEYAARLYAKCRKGPVDGFIDRMILCALIEARSCERFALLGEQLTDKTLAEFYASLFESEARHYATYIKLAIAHAPEADVRARLDVLADAEAEINATGEPVPRLHT
ncbi:MAG: tRNA-(ms[2]io[6]A)-hydroxylase [Bradymonadia bacterium]